MPVSLAGLWITIAVFIPGYVYYAIRRQLVPTRRLSRAMELAGLVLVAAAANAATLMLYFALRFFPLIRENSPSPSDVLRDPTRILVSDSTLVRATATIILLLLFASILSAAFAYRLGPLRYISRRLAPAVAETSGWYHVFESLKPEGSRRLVICELMDGSSVAGELAWFNTSPEESADRDIVLAPPFGLTSRRDGEVITPQNIHLIVVSARDIQRLFISYLTNHSTDPS